MLDRGETAGEGDLAVYHFHTTVRSTASRSPQSGIRRYLAGMGIRTLLSQWPATGAGALVPPQLPSFRRHNGMFPQVQTKAATEDVIMLGNVSDVKVVKTRVHSVNKAVRHRFPPSATQQGCGKTTKPTLEVVPFPLQHMSRDPIHAVHCTSRQSGIFKYVDKFSLTKKLIVTALIVVKVEMRGHRKGFKNISIKFVPDTYLT
ncbi:hypothetical protein J6590_067101 [Homalodisca vitripennis]|nr:hypothetical protein J6590_067101 [Homalodisca vitripennis]